LIYAEQVINLTVKDQSALLRNDRYLCSRGVNTLKRMLNEPDINKRIDEDNEVNVNDLRHYLMTLPDIQKPRQYKKLRGILFPAILMSCGWWDRMGKSGNNDLKWKDGLQEWLFNGFDLWGPSWDYIWDMDINPSEDSHPFFLAQLGDGDEANSLPVVIPREKALKLKSYFQDTWGGLDVRICGMLVHRDDFPKQLQDMHIENLIEKNLDYCIWLDPNNPKHLITPLAGRTEIYSGYLWKCVIPKKWYIPGKQPNLDQVYYLWEHTNFANKDAVKYNLDSLLHKEKFLEQRHGELVLIQKSSSLVPGKPEWSADKIYDLLVSHQLAESI